MLDVAASIAALVSTITRNITVLHFGPVVAPDIPDRADALNPLDMRHFALERAARTRHEGNVAERVTMAEQLGIGVGTLEVGND